MVAQNAYAMMLNNGRKLGDNKGEYETLISENVIDIRDVLNCEWCR